MKHFKKFFSYLVALTMVLSLAAFTGVKVHGEDAAKPVTYKITLDDNTKTKTTDHTYHAYQIFSGDLKVNEDKDKTKVLSNIHWGTGIDSSKKDALISALKSNDTLKDKFGNVTDAASVAKALEGVKSNSTEMDAFAHVVGQYLSDTSTSSSVDAKSKKTEITGLAAGYYLVKDTLDTDKDGKVKNENDAYTKFIVDVVGDTTATIKSDVPTVEKKVKDVNDSNATSTTEPKNPTDWQDSADYDIGDYVPYQITGTMPANIADYTTYKYEFTDTMSQGLTYVNDKDDKDHKTTIKIGDTDVTKSFTENVTTNADGSTTVTWSCDNLKNKEDTENNKLKNITLTKDSTVVVTYFAKLNDKAEIGSAGNPNTVYLKYSNNPNYTGKGENSPEGKTPEDKNIVFTYKLDVNKYKDKIDKDHKTDEAVFKLYKEIKGTNGKLDVKNVTLTKADKVYSAVGLDDGVYILQETKAPDGYNKIDGNVTFAGTTYENAREFTVEATHSNSTDTLDPELTSLTGTKKTGEITLTSVKKDNSDKPTGTLTTDVIDKKGSTLPSTGGMGTTLLYVAGGILVACAAAYVVMIRKHSTNK